MNTILDILGASVIGGLILLMVMNFNLFTSDVKLNSDAELQLQTNAKTLAEIINYDLRKVGFNYNGTSVITADEKKFTFWGDIDSNGVADKISYYLGDTTEVYGTENPKDKILYREVNGVKQGGASLGLVDLKFHYRTAEGNVAATLDEVKYIEAEIWVQSPYKVHQAHTGKDDYLFTYWEMTINPRNI